MHNYKLLDIILMSGRDTEIIRIQVPPASVVKKKLSAIKRVRDLLNSQQDNRN